MLIKPEHTKRIFDWKLFKSWKVDIEKLFADILTPQVIETISKSPKKIPNVDNPTFIKSLIKEFPIFDDFTPRFVSYYSQIRTYHLCRPLDTDSYYKNGLLILDAEEMQKQFKSFFLNDDFPEISEEDIEYAISTVSTETRDQVLYLGLDDRFLMEYCGHYLVYGSEYFLSMCGGLPIDRETCRSVIRSKGTPTVFIIDLPIEFITPDQTGQLWNDIISQWGYSISHSLDDTVEVDFGITIDKNIPPDCISGHYQPDKIKDPSAGFKLFDVRTGQHIEHED
jgi:hypothetical protein